MFGLFLLRIILRKLVPFLSKVLYMLFWLFSLPFSLLNGLQRHLSKPWRIFYKHHHGSDGFNKFMRRFWWVMKIPLYILLTPLRFVNAVFYDLFMHCGFEFYNYISEIFDPSSILEGSANLMTWILLSPIRLVKYTWHFLLTLIESCIWVLVDTIYPALTLYHGTDETASESITGSPGRLERSKRISGIWLVGSGNYAGNGIYFAPIRSTALHYSGGNKRVLIVCRVSLGRVIDVGMAPKNVYYQCGHPNATEATRWGLKHGYTTGEWWRDDVWWEYCMYEWKGRYKEGWRIRPLYVEELYSGSVHRIHGGMVHWLFRVMVIKDLWKSFFRRSH